MSKKMVAYFSASGVTADVAEKLAEILGAERYEIRPEAPYTREDLNWQDPNSRSSLEMKDKYFRTALADKDAKIEDYDVIFVGFPIWWGTAPTIVNTFLESYDFTGKEIVLFATSGSSDFGKSVADLQGSAGDAIVKEGVIIHGKQDMDTWKRWAESL